MRSWRARRSWDCRLTRLLTRLLLLLHLQLALLHFLQQLLRCLYARLVPWLGLFRLSRALVSAVIGRAIIRRFGFGSGSVCRVGGRRRSAVGGRSRLGRGWSVRRLGD